MNLIIMHHHLRKGGVTDVITQSLTALVSDNNFCSEFSNIIVIVGESPAQQADIFHHPRIKIVEEPAIGYLDSIEDMGKASISQNLVQLFEHYSKESMWWIHNHHLGKNPIFTRVLMDFLNDHEVPCILQIHDFPENGRFGNIDALRKELPLSLTYRGSPSCVYAVINTHDQTILAKSGIKSYFLPNIVSFKEEEKSGVSAREVKDYISQNYVRKKEREESLSAAKGNEVLFTYPVRCIRRKNAIEAGLIARLYEHQYRVPVLYCLTLAGTSHTEVAYSHRVESLFETGALKGAFNIGNDLDETVLSFRDICRASDAILSSSIQEGFGFSFLNSVVWNTPLFAKDISVTADINAVLQKDWSYYWYEGLRIPASLFTEAQKQSLYASYEARIQALTVVYDDDIIARLRQEIASTLLGETLDFSFLSVDMQCDVVSRSAHEFEVICKENKEILTALHKLIVSSPISSVASIQQEEEKRTALLTRISRMYGASSFCNTFLDLSHNAMQGKGSYIPHEIDRTQVSQGIFTHYAHKDLLRALYHF